MTTRAEKTMLFVNLRVVHTTGAMNAYECREGVRNVMVEASLGLSLFS